LASAWIVGLSAGEGFQATGIEGLPILSVQSGAVTGKPMEVPMPSRSDFDTDVARLTDDTAHLTRENGRLRRVNGQMLAALKYALPLLRDALPEAIDLDWTKEAVAKVQDAIAEGECDP
jgi:hypothetical protein